MNWLRRTWSNFLRYNKRYNGMLYAYLYFRLRSNVGFLYFQWDKLGPQTKAELGKRIMRLSLAIHKAALFRNVVKTALMSHPFALHHLQYLAVLLTQFEATRLQAKACLAILEQLKD